MHKNFEVAFGFKITRFYVFQVSGTISEESNLGSLSSTDTIEEVVEVMSLRSESSETEMKQVI